MKKRHKSKETKAIRNEWKTPVMERLADILAGNKKKFLMVRFEPVEFIVEWQQKFFGKIHIVNLGAAGVFFKGTLVPVPEEVWNEKAKEPLKYVFDVTWKDGKTFTYSNITLNDVERMVKQEDLS